MSTAKAVAVQGAAADQAFRRVKPLLDQLKNNIKKASELVAKEYAALPRLEKAAFAQRVQTEYGWSRDRLSTFARIGREGPKKLRVISSRAPATKIDDLDVTVMEEIVATPDSTLKAAADAGMFDKPVTHRQIRNLRKTGRIPEDKPKPASTPLTKIRSLMADAENHMKKACWDIDRITSIMEDEGITDAKGKEATALVQTFQKLCTSMATANPETSKRAFAILRGEA